MWWRADSRTVLKQLDLQDLSGGAWSWIGVKASLQHMNITDLTSPDVN